MCRLYWIQRRIHHIMTCSRFPVGFSSSRRVHFRSICQTEYYLFHFHFLRDTLCIRIYRIRYLWRDKLVSCSSCNSITDNTGAQNAPKNTTEFYARAPRHWNRIGADVFVRICFFVSMHARWEKRDKRISRWFSVYLIGAMHRKNVCVSPNESSSLKRGRRKAIEKNNPFHIAPLSMHPIKTNWETINCECVCMSRSGAVRYSIVAFMYYRIIT